MSSHAFFVALVLAVAAQRLVEVVISRRHEAALRKRGAVEHVRQQMPFMVAVHTLWLVSMLLEVLLWQRAFALALAAPAILVFALGQILRIAAIRALGPRWTVTVMILPNEPRITKGIFRFVRHPNYLGVVLEMASLPLVHGAWVTACAFSIANGLVLAWRIPAEERALARTPSVQES